MAEKTERLALRIEPEKKRVWSAFAQTQGGRGVTSFVVRAVDSVVTSTPYLRPDEIDALDQLREQLRRAGINLNVLLRELQAHNRGTARTEPDPVDWAETRNQLNDALGQIHDFLRLRR